MVLRAADDPARGAGPGQEAFNSAGRLTSR